MFCYTPTDHGKIISGDAVTQDEYPFVSEEFLREHDIPLSAVKTKKTTHGPSGDAGSINSAKIPAKKRGSIADFIFISDSPVCISIPDTPVCIDEG